MDILFGLALSYHVNFEGTYNSIHPQIRLEHDHFISGLYYNSEDNISAYAGFEYDWNKFYVEGGAVTGYSQSDIVPFARLGYKLGDVSIFVAPGIETRRGVSEIHPIVGIEILKKAF